MGTSMELHRMENRAADGYVRFGSYWGKGTVKPVGGISGAGGAAEGSPAGGVGFTATGANGQRVPLQSEIRAVWPDGSVKWAAHIADAKALGERVTITADAGGEIGGTGGEEAAADISGAIRIDDAADALVIHAGERIVRVPRRGDSLFSLFTEQAPGADASHPASVKVHTAYAALLLEHREGLTENGTPKNVAVEEFRGRTDDVRIVTAGPLCAVVRIAGTHVSLTDGHEQIPFTIFLEIFRDSPELRFTHTFFYDGDENRDYLKGIGISFETPITGAFYNRHVKFGIDHGYFSEANAMLLGWRPRVPKEIYQNQIAGHFLRPTEEEQENIFGKVEENIPIWGEYALWQDAASHYVIRKKISDPGCCYIEGLHGNRAKGVMAFGGESGGAAIALRDFWQKYPSTLQVTGMDTDAATASLWFYSPEQEAFDFRHYATRGYSQVYYEGFDNFGASPYGIACTSEFSLLTFDGELPSDEALDVFVNRVQRPAVYAASPEYYHAHRAFGYWSLPGKDTAAERWLEDALEKTAGFYLEEVDRRGWYGLFNYGDFMHTYDAERHTWRYDMGGYAWDNTELVPTLWLWYYFLRTGREDIFSLAEALSRHTSEVDIYHFGSLQGLGSRHNVRHWGCPCKEARIAMAGHHRFLYYLTGDYRLGDVFDEVKDADFSTLNMDPLRFFFDKDKMVYPTHARSGPDWSSFNSNWMTAWERTGDERWLKKLQTGIDDLYATPMKLVSGSDFEYDPETSHLRYIGDRATGGTHLEICQGAEQTWLELTDLLDDERWNKMLADFGTFYPLSNEEQNRLTDGRIKQREFSFPFMAGGVIAYGAHYYQDHALGRQVWEIMRDCMEKEFGESLLARVEVENAGNQAVLDEMPGVSTNVMAQWSLNTIVALEFAREDLPEAFD